MPDTTKPSVSQALTPGPIVYQEAHLNPHECLRLIEIAHTTPHENIRELALQLLQWEMTPVILLAEKPGTAGMRDCLADIVRQKAARDE